jgi:hypothetical protein
LSSPLFSYVVYDLDIRRIVDFRLKPWADRFLVLYSVLYEDDETSENGSPSGIKPQAEDVAPEGFQPTSGASPQTAAQRLLLLLYPRQVPQRPISKDETERETRNEEIRHRYDAGERVVDLAREYCMTIQGVYRILRSPNS